DKAWLEKAADRNLDSTVWTAPKNASVGVVVVFNLEVCFFSPTATIKSSSRPRPGWRNRYGAALTTIKLIQPAISLGSIRRHIPTLTWAIYPRSITTPDVATSEKIRELIRSRRKTRTPDIDDDALAEANIDELRAVALLKALPSPTPRERRVWDRARSVAVARYVLLRARGICEGCKKPAPFRKSDGTPYLEPHHTLRLADEGPDHPRHVIAVCPTCHRRAHYAEDAKAFNRYLIRTVANPTVVVNAFPPYGEAFRAQELKGFSYATAVYSGR